ncbi:hypothetical protein CRUP_030134 [Coryphaenoides rupestris]|nr:hypothetical protein CRUP_030134 [Coryphaenoides rupestris]
MAAPVTFGRNIYSLTKIVSGIPRLIFITHGLLACLRIFIVTDEPDTLFQKVSVLVKGHDRSVLDSYEFFASMAAKGAGFEPPKDIERLTLLKSIHIFKKHRAQYEMRTHYRSFELLRVTGSTAQVYLEYIQRNLPEGVAMEVSKTMSVKIPEHILEPMWEEPPTDNTPTS